MKKFKTNVEETKTTRRNNEIEKNVHFSAKIKNNKLIIRYHGAGFVMPTKLVFNDPSCPVLGKGITDKDVKICLKGLNALLKNACTENYPLSRDAEKAVKKSIRLLKWIPLPFWLKKEDGKDIKNADEAFILTGVKQLKRNIALTLNKDLVSKIAKNADKGQFVTRNGGEKTIALGKQMGSKVADVKDEKNVSIMKKALDQIDRIIANRKAAVNYTLKTYVPEELLENDEDEDENEFRDLGDGIVTDAPAQNNTPLLYAPGIPAPGDYDDAGFGDDDESYEDEDEEDLGMTNIADPYGRG